MILFNDIVQTYNSSNTAKAIDPDLSYFSKQYFIVSDALHTLVSAIVLSVRLSANVRMRVDGFAYRLSGLQYVDEVC